MVVAAAGAGLAVPAMVVGLVGLEASLTARTVPLVLGAVKYAQDTGRALEARGLG